MENTRFSNKKKEIPASGIYKPKIPELLKYPQPLKFDNAGQSIKNILCYVIKGYGNIGLSILIYRIPKDDQVVVVCGDWEGNKIDISNTQNTLEYLANEFLQNKIMILYETMRLIRLDQAQFFFAIVNNNLVLVDIQVGLNKFASPGMVRDIFGKVLHTQDVVKIELIDDRAFEHITRGIGTYSGDLIIKPSRFRMFNLPSNNYTPLYVEVIRQ